MARSRPRIRRDGPSLAVAITLIRWIAALVFIGFGIGKFVNHGTELASFQQYGLPAPDAFVYAIGVVEIGGGLLLAWGRGVRLAALVLAGDMVGAIIVSGIARGENISLTLAPVMLVLMLFLLLVGPGSGPREWLAWLRLGRPR